MIVHRIGEDTRVSFDWYDDDEEQITVDSAMMSVDDVDVTADLLTINGTYALEVHIEDDYDITAGNHAYYIAANDGTDEVLIAQGLLRVHP